MSNTLLAALRRNLSPQHRQLLDEIENDPVVQGVLEKAGQHTLSHRAAKVAERAALPAKHAKAIKLTTAELLAATEAELRAEEVLAGARARRVSAYGSAYGVEMRARQEAQAIDDELRATGPAQLTAACRAVRAFSITPYAPALVFLAVSRTSRYGDENLAAVEAAAAANHNLHQQLLAAEGALVAAARELEGLQLEALSDADVAERVTAIFRALNLALSPLKGKPHFVIDEHFDVVVKFGHDETAYTVKPADIGAEKKQ
jgi:hypothetical protein